ncbi:MAG: phenylalanine--tRNA ligase subunit beta [Thermoflexales bacterium]|nr:phenylalanine--tRNA ligase subunit beta [Thermoflexales bacterium]
MRVPISWLKEYVDLTLSPEQLAEKLTLAGLEVEQVEYIGLPGSELPWDRDKIFVGQVVRVERHPNADRLLLATVDYGADAPITVVTGAPNLHLGEGGPKVVLALRGARLYDGHKEGKVIMTLKEATLRGIKNDSMVCSEKELGLSDEHEGILILPEDAPVGVPLADYLGDVVLHVAVLPSTARCASIIGIAREVAALTGQTLRYPDMRFVATGTPAEDELRLEITDGRLNPRFTASIVRGLRIAPSPFWMQRRLTLCGMRPINNLVDISNYVMLELGQPNHIFDLHGVRRGQSGKRTILTRYARPGETLVTLDGVTRTLQPTDILVCDEVGPLSLAGVMGGLESEVKPETTEVLVEVATWEPAHIRKTVRHHNLPSEAASRFARGVPPAIAMTAQHRLLHLLQTLAGGKIGQGILDAYPMPQPVVQVALRPNRVRQVLGVEIPTERMVSILRALEFGVTESNGELQVIAPSHRLDIEGEHDLIEEIARIHGYDAMPATLMAEGIPPAQGDPALVFEERLRDVLAGLGLQEVITYRLTAPEHEARLLAAVNAKRGDGRDGSSPELAYIRLANPLTPERSVMRRSLLPGLLDVLEANLRHHERVAVFEVGAIYIPRAGALLPDELPRLGIVLSGISTERHWRVGRSEVMDFYHLKGILEGLFDAINIRGVQWQPAQHPALMPGRAAQVMVGGENVGVFGELHPLVRERWDLPAQPVLLAELDVMALQRAQGADRTIADVPRFPATIEDLAVIVDERVTAAEVEQVIRQAGGELLGAVRLFDVYRGEQVGAGRKSLAWSLVYQAPDRTLTAKEAEKLRGKIIRTLESRLGATIRQ